MEARHGNEDRAMPKGETQRSEWGVRRSSGDVVGNSESDRSVDEVENRCLLSSVALVDHHGQQ